ncbi:glycosyltransferase family 2 protein [Mongoliitalea lutea]|uniref:Glycosyltransferase 2-like domain-containing protein n=1 Tax=Mongoliitalea lutea TaxID=849756 RepID=A0A8J3G5H8_9BACT|nr:glycosyltransferase family 2 protein [Mongoliitalea lutea]GHB37120.1 hypothetical protein GCM10008106_18010 [Mongoliitalea lutea]
MEKVSVIIALYNAEKYIEETLKSVTHQTYSNIEIVVVNDGSSDNSVEVIERMAIPNLTLYTVQNSGQCAASNFGIKKASGELIKFLDADDILDHRVIENMVLKWKENPNRLVFGPWRYFSNNPEHSLASNYFFFKDYSFSLDWYIEVLKTSEAMLAGWMWLIPKSILEKSDGWDERLHLMNDFEFSTRLILNSDGIGFATEAIHFYRKGLTNAMTSKMNDKIAMSIFTGVNTACENILLVEDSIRTRAAFSNQFQKWVYHLYPSQKSIVRLMESKIKELGGSELTPEGGKIFQLLIIILPWKFVRYIQWVLHKSIWKPVLSWKMKNKMKSNFGN